MISGGKAHVNTRKLNQNISTVTDVFLNQKRVNVCEHTIKMVSRFLNVPPGGCERGRDGGKFKRKLSEVNTRAVSRGHIKRYKAYKRYKDI